MKVDSCNNYKIYSKPAFTSAFPVVHWVKEAKGGYSPVYSMELIQKLQEIIVKTLNENPLKIKKPPKNNKNTVTSEVNKQLYDTSKTSKDFLRLHLSTRDVDYRNMPASCKNKVRSYYNRKYYTYGDYSPLSYIITGGDVKTFDDKYSKPIGRAYREARAMNISGETPKITEAKRKYNEGGLQFVNNYIRRIKDKRGNTEVLHTKFEIIRDEKTGGIKDFCFVDANFLPEFGPGNPLQKYRR